MKILEPLSQSKMYLKVNYEFAYNRALNDIYYDKSIFSLEFGFDGGSVIVDRIGIKKLGRDFITFISSNDKLHFIDLSKALVYHYGSPSEITQVYINNLSSGGYTLTLRF